MNFETSYQLEEFRAIQPELFDESGKAYYNIDLRGPAEDMLKLINQMEQEIIDLQTKLAETYI
jgi:hypothetical protein